MQDYQRMAPRKLTDETLKSILWNKVPIELQKEVTEITDGSVQELLHKLLKAEAVLQERSRRSTQQTSKRYLVGTGVKPQRYSNPDVELVPLKKQQQATNSSSEMSLQRVKCFNCHQKGHLAKNCTLSRKIHKRVTIQSDVSPLDSWFHAVFVVDATTGKCQVSSKGPTYNVNIIVGVPARGLLDHGAQVTLARQELLPKVRERD